jgi:quercetin dioxygenase-like cupin family protein
LSLARTALISLLLVFAFAGRNASADAPIYQKLLTPLFSGGQTIVGQDIAYPAGNPKVTAAMVIIGPGKETGWHTHEVPLFVYVMKGEISVDYGSKGVKVYKPGDSFLEAMNWPHNATNKGTEPVQILAVYMGAAGKTDAAPAPGPK